MLQVDATPICDFLKSSASNPTACSMARLAARSGPSTTMDENARSAGCPFFCERANLGVSFAINKGTEFHLNQQRWQERMRVNDWRQSCGPDVPWSGWLTL